MSFVHPGIAYFAFAMAATPLLIHLIHRRRYQVEPWAAMAFLRRAEARSRRRMRLEEWLLLALRTAAILAVGLAAARPRPTGSAGSALFGAAAQDRVIVLDDTLSMTAQGTDGATSFDRAAAAARALIDRFPPSDRVAVVTTSSPARAWPTTDRDALRELIGGLKCASRSDDLRGALRRATELVADRGAASTAVAYVFSDFARGSVRGGAGLSTGVSTGDAPPAAAEVDSAEPLARRGFDRVVLVDVGSDGRQNATIAEARCEGALMTAGMPIRLAVEVVNHGDEPVRGAIVEIVQGERVIRTMPCADLEPGGRAWCRCEIEFAGPGPQRLVARLKEWNDALAADDRRNLAIDVRSRVPILGVASAARDGRDPGPLFFFATALGVQQARRGEDSFRWREVDPEELAAEPIEDAEVIVLGDVEQLPRAAWGKLGRYVRDGGGLIALLGPRSSAEHWNRMSTTLGAPGRILPVSLASARTIDDSGPGAWEGMTLADEAEAVFADLAWGAGVGGLSTARVFGHWGVEAVSADGGIRTLIRSTGGRPLLLAAEQGRGRVLVWTAGADMAWSNLPAKPDYVPWAMNLVAYAGGWARESAGSRVGEAIAIDPPRGGSWREGLMTSPGGIETRVENIVARSGAAPTFRDTDEPGFYGFRSGDWRREYAVNVDPDEGALARADEEEIAGLAREAAGATIVEVASVEASLAGAAGAPGGRELVGACMTVLFALVLVETLAAAWLGAGR